jgi:hypothetical protein
VNIVFKPTAKFRTEDHNAVLARITERNAKGRTLRAKDAAIQKSIDNEESNDPNLKSRLSDLISGRSPTPPTPWEVQRHAVKVEIQDNDDDLDFLSAKARQFEIEAEKKMVDDARPQIVAAEKEIFETFSKLFNQVLPYWQAKRHLHGNSVRTYDLFANSFDTILGVPSDLNSAWAELFREGIAAGYISKMPAALLPKR